MKYFKSRMALAVLGISFAVFHFLIMNVQIFYGGYEGLLHHGLNALIDAQTIEVRAEIVIAPNGEHLSELMNMTIIAQGNINRQDRSSLIELGLLNNAAGDLTPIAKVVHEGNSLLLMPEDEGEPVDLSGFIAVESDTFNKEDWDRVYQTLLISEVTEIDPRLGKGYLEGTFVNYELDLVSLLLENQSTMIEEILGEDILEKGLVVVDLQVDTSGDLAVIRIDFDAGIFTAEGWITLEV